MASLSRCLAMVAALGLCGCVQTSRIEAEDNRVFVPAFRAAVSLSEEKQAPAQVQTGNAVELGYVKIRGADTQFLEAGRSPVILGGQTFSAPQTLRNRFDLSVADLSWRWRRFFGDRSIGLEVLAGPASVHLDLAVASTTQQASQTFTTQGPHAGVGVLWRLEPHTSVQARIAGFVSASDEGVNGVTRGELAIARALDQNLGVRLGYAYWEVKGHGQTAISDFRLRVSGPSLTLEVNF